MHSVGFVKDTHTHCVINTEKLYIHIQLLINKAPKGIFKVFSELKKEDCNKTLMVHWLVKHSSSWFIFSHSICCDS